MSKRLFWTQDRREKLRSMWKRGATTKELTEAFGMQMHSISARAYRMNLGPRKGTQPQDLVRAALKKLERATRKELTKATGLSDSATDRALARMKAIDEVCVVGTRLVLAGRGHANSVEAFEYALVDDEADGAMSPARHSGEPHVNRVKHRAGTAQIPQRHPLTVALFGSV
jgi:hypothetical protein